MTLRWLMFWWWLVMATGGEGHVVSQMFGRWERGGDEWMVELTFDAGYADPGTRFDAQMPPPTKEWLLGLAREKRLELAVEAESYVREWLSVTSQGEVMAYEVRIPGLLDEPPKIRSTLSGLAYFTVEIKGRCERWRGLEVEVSGGDHPDLLLLCGKDEEDEASYLLIESGVSKEVAAGEGGKPVQGLSAVWLAWVQGFRHVVPQGLDHVLFVLGLFLLDRRWRPMVQQSLAFTAAHTVTLGLAAGGVLKVPGEWVEPLIALSIAVLGVENLWSQRVSSWRWVVVFGFGLVHGLGFAGVLSRWIVPGVAFLPTLLAANMGVEMAQVAILFAAWVLTWRWHETEVYRWVRRAGCVGLVVTGLWWTFERMM